MSDCRYPWERDPLNEPPHMAKRFDNNRELVSNLEDKISSLEAKLKIAKEALRWYAIDDNPAGCQTARNALSRLNEEK